MNYDITMCSFGPTADELIGGSDELLGDSKWYRVTPIDVSLDGEYVYDLIAADSHKVGTVIVIVNAGVMTVEYKVASGNVFVKEEALMLYASREDLIAGNAVNVDFASNIDLAETFGDNNKIIVSLVLIGDYNVDDADVTEFVIDDEVIDAMIAMIEE